MENIAKEKRGPGRPSKAEAVSARLRETILEASEDLYAVGALGTGEIAEIRALVPTPVPTLEPEDIRAIREAAGVTQATMARLLNVSVSALFQWEQGVKRPSGSSLKLLALAKRHGIGHIM